jgi:hypothetical protein
MTIQLDDIAAVLNTTALNNNFQKIEDELNTGVLKRQGLGAGQANQMLVNLDMNSRSILNVNTLNAQEVLVKGKSVDALATTASNAAISASASAVAAGLSEDSAAADAIRAEAAANTSDALVLRNELADASDPAKGSALLGYKGRTVYAKLNEYVSVKDFGATGNGGVDDTAAIQAALDSSLNVFVPEGVYLISATLTMRSKGSLVGAGAEKSIILRLSNFGDSLRIGDTVGQTFGANDFAVKDIWFYRPFTYTAGVTTTIDNPVAADAASIRVYGGQRGLIDSCFFSAMPYNVVLEQTSLTTISRSTFNGIWDPAIVGLQEGIASIYLKSSGSNANTLLTIDNNHISGGFFTAPRSVTIGAATFNT